MGFYGVVDQVVDLLRRRGRVTYRALKREFQVDDAFLEDLKAELITAQRLAIDEQGEVLVWAGEVETPPALQEAVPPPPGESASTERRHPEAERRQITVMFCDLADSTRLSQQLDPEDLREVIRSYQQTSAEAIERFDGYIAQHLGDGLLIYFGWPVAHEDDAQRAVHAGLGIVEAITTTLNPHLEAEKGVQFTIRLGIHTGPVVVGEMGGGGRHEHLATGETVNIAARLEGLAQPNTMVISQVTSRLVERAFALEDLGLQMLKGVAEPMQVFRVLSLRETHADDTVAIGVPFLVGRDEEVGLLLRRWDQSKEGLGQVVLLSGEAGIGKSRLVEVLSARVEHAHCRRITFRCSPYHTNSALYPVLEHIQRLLHFRPDDTPQARLARLEHALMPYHLPLAEAVPLLAAWLSLPHPEAYPPLRLEPQQQRQKTQAALVAWLLAEAERQPVLVVGEDLHWADPSTLEWLGLFMEQVPTARVLTLLTCRPEFRPPWPQRSYLTQLTLTRLSRPQVEEMVRLVVGGKPLPAEVMQHIVVQTDGVPLYVEEMTKLVLESGLVQACEDRYELTGPLPALAIPTTLRDALMARLDRLTTAKAVAQLGATLGRTFSYDLLHAVSPLDEATLQRELGRLVEAELLYQRGQPPQATYLFKHALIQEAAYQSLLRSTRQQYHERTAQVLAERFAETVEAQPELLAHHYTEAGLNAQAVGYWQRAGQRASTRSAYVEAIAHLTKGLEVLTTLPDTRERAQQELELQTTLGPALMNTKGFMAPEVERVYAQARVLCQQVGDARQLFRVLWGLFYWHMTRGELQRAREVGEELLGVAQRLHDPELFVVAHRVLGNASFWRGELGLAYTHAQHALARYDPQQMHDHAVRYGQDSSVACRIFGAITLWLLGYPDQAQQWSETALTHAQGLGHAFTLAQALLLSALLHLWRREAAVAQEQAEAQRALCTEQGFALYLPWGTIEWGAALAAQGAWAEGLAQMRQGLAAYRVRGRLPQLLLLGLLAEAYGRAGQVEEGLGALHEALEVMQTSEERLYEAEVYRLRGELLLQQSAAQQGEAEASFQQTLTVARHQQAKSWELRAAMSLARLWQQQGKHAEARQLLAEVYGWFTEGFETADLQEAKALLEALS